MNYVLQYIDERYDGISAIGYWDWDNAIQMDGSEPFTMNDFENWRYDKNIGQWVEGEIDEETGEWSLKT